VLWRDLDTHRHRHCKQQADHPEQDRRDGRAGVALSSSGAALPLHQLRHGANGPLDRRRKLAALSAGNALARQGR
jgi:hypothetical protein